MAGCSTRSKQTMVNELQHKDGQTDQHSNGQKDEQWTGILDADAEHDRVRHARRFARRPNSLVLTGNAKVT